MAQEDFDFERFNNEFDTGAIAMEEAAKLLVPMFVTFRKEGLPAQEAAALTAAFVSQMMPQTPQKPQED